jgi:oligopeptide transport system substrate-binding protein
MKNRIFVILLAVVLVISLAACNTNTTDQQTPSTPTNSTNPANPTTPTTPTNPGDPQRITEFAVTEASAPETIDPQRNSSVDGAIYLVHLSEGLMKYKYHGGGVEPGLAESYDISDDGLVWTFHLRSGLKWSDGQPLTAHDLEYTWKRLVDPVTASPYAFDVGVFVKNGDAVANGELPLDEFGVKALNDQTFEVTLEGPCAYFDEVATFPAWMPTRRDMVEQYGDRWATSPNSYISCGPFKMEDLNMDAYLTVVPNEYYYNKEAIVPTRLTFEFLADEVAMVNALQSGQVAFSRLIPGEERAMLKDKGLYGVYADLGTYYVCFQNERPPYDDVNVRKALTLAIDRRFITDVLLEGAYLPATAFVGPGFTDVSGEFYKEGKYYDYDYEKNKELARQALAEAGYENGAGFPKLEYMTNPTTLHLSIAEAMQAMWKEVLNIDAEISQQEWNVFLDTRRNGGFYVARHGWIADFNDPLNLLNIFLSTGGNNDANYKVADYDNLLKIALTSSDRAERMKVMHEAEDLLIGRDWAIAPIMYYVTEYAADPTLKGWGYTPLGYQFFHEAYIDK